jgi:polar amino acid transport system permease protein
MDIVDTFFNTDVLVRAWPLLIKGLWITLQLGVARIIAGLLLGLFLAIVHLYSVRPLRILAKVYIDIFRSIPLLVLLIVVYYALPFVGIRLSPFASAMAALTMVSGAYASEIFRAGIEAVPKGQFEASAALGMNSLRTMADVILPQAIKTDVTVRFLKLAPDLVGVFLVGIRFHGLSIRLIDSLCGLGGASEEGA